MLQPMRSGFSRCSKRLNKMINEYLLFFSLFFPRISLFFAYVSHAIPVNPVPYWGDVVLAIFVPRVLMIIYIASTLGWDNGWMVAHIIFLILAWGSSGVSASSSRD